MRALGKTPLKFGLLPSEHKALVLKASGFEPSVVILDGQGGTQSIHLTPQPWLKIVSEPSEAIVRYNGKRLGYTPLSIEQRPEENQISLQFSVLREGYQPFTLRVKQPATDRGIVQNIKLVPVTTQNKKSQHKEKKKVQSKSALKVRQKNTIKNKKTPRGIPDLDPLEPGEPVDSSRYIEREEFEKVY